MTESQLDLTEFVSKLIHDTFNAIAISSKEQAEIYFEITRLASLDYETFKLKYITDAAVDEELLRYFPVTEETAHPHGIYEDAPYLFDLETGKETPDLSGSFSFETDKSQRKKSRLTARTVENIREYVRDYLASQHYSAFKEIVKRGIPRVIIESGRILAKLSLKATEIENDDTETPETSATALSKSALNKSLLSRRIVNKISKTRVGVTLPDPGNTTTQTTTSLWGEVEIKFRTVD
jgi:hypothetical protein